MADTTQQQPIIEIKPPCLEWMDRTRQTLGITTYLAGQVFFLGARTATQATITVSGSRRCMGAAASQDGRTIWISSQHQMWRMERSPLPPTAPFDCEYAPRAVFTVGDVDGHDIGLGVDEGDLPLLVSARYSCLARPGRHACFEAVWKPPFITKIAAEDRCHLNGLAMRDGHPAYCTAVAETDFVGGWRDHRSGGGVVMEIPSGEVVCRGLSMPHSPRWHEGRLYLMNSGSGEFGAVDLQTGRFEPLAFLPGYGRGMVFSEGWVVVGLSDCRETRTFQGLPLDEGLRKHELQARCGLYAVELATGRTEEFALFRHPIREIYDVFSLPGTRQMNVLPLEQGLWHEDLTGAWTL
jgi:uncharacterized protein (TIGR03032 family)